MGTNLSNQFDRLPDEIVEYIFMLITYSPPIDPSNHTYDSSSGLMYFSYEIHEPCLRRAFKDLKSLERVCRRFHKILHSPTFWLRKCHRDHVVINNEQLALKQEIDFQRFYYSNPFHPDYNLLASKNATPNNKKHLWKQKIDIEKIPIGCDILYDVFKQISPCFVTSYEWSRYELANINLIKQEQDMLIKFRTRIEFSVCIAGRWDCSYEYKLKLTFSDGHTWDCEDQITNGDNRWRRITYRYGKYPKGRRPPNVSIQIRGKDIRFWAGNFGAKFAQIKLRLILRDENDQDEEEIKEILKEPEICNHDEYSATH